jgi:DNA polymerase III delta subunit
MSYRQFLKEKDNGFKESVYLLYGTDPFFLKSAETMIKTGINEEHRDFGLDIYDLEPASAKKVSMKEVLDSLNTFSFFSENKMVIVLNIQKLKKAELQDIEGYLANPSSSSTLFMFHAGKLKATTKKSTSGCRSMSLDHTAQELKGWLSSYAKEKGISMSSQVSDYLTVILGNDAGLLASEINKLSLLGKDTIELRDLGDIIYGEAGIDTFEFTGALASGNRKKAFNLLRGMNDADSNMLLGAINWQISRLKGRKSSGTMLKYYKTLLEADTINKSTGSTYPLELLATKLLGR